MVALTFHLEVSNMTELALPECLRWKWNASLIHTVAQISNLKKIHIDVYCHANSGLAGVRVGWTAGTIIIATHQCDWAQRHVPSAESWLWHQS